MQGIDSSVTERMQADWNARAREDAHFYVAFGRQQQDDEEFFATAGEVVKGLEWEMRRLSPARPSTRRALEIGCGPGRLMRPLSRHFGEIHGVDVSDEMVARARRNLAGIAHAHPHHGSGSDLAQFADESFDFVYSYAVFQHIPSREVVMSYLHEAWRVLRIGGILRVQINGLDQTAKQYDTWSGVRISADEVRRYAREHGLQLLALEGMRTQYMWATMRKPDGTHSQPGLPRICRVTNANNSEPVAPQSGRFASLTVWVKDLPSACDLLNIDVRVGGLACTPCYIGPREADGVTQLNVLLPQLPRTGLLQLTLASQEGEALCEPAAIRIIPAPPDVPYLLSVTDGINMMSGTRIVTGTVKVTVEQTTTPQSFAATLGGQPLHDMDVFCADPLPPRYEINCRIPETVPPGTHVLEMQLGRRKLPSVELDVVSPQT